MTLPAALPAPSHAPLRGGPALRWGIMAPGRIASVWAATVLANTDQKIVAVASRSLDKAQEFAATHAIAHAYGDYEQLAADPEVDAVYIAAPHSEHPRLALLAIAAGKHVLVEKPIAVSVADARLIVDAARAAGVYALEAMWTRYLPQTTIIDRLIRDGVLGELRLVAADFGAVFEFDPASRAFDPALGGGALLDIGVYPISFAHFVLGSPERVTTTGSLAVTGVDDQSTVILDYPGGAQAVAFSSMLAETPNTASVNGTLARVEVAGRFWQPSGLRLIAGDDVLEWTDVSGVTGGAGLAYPAVAMAADIGAGHTESPLHTLDDTLEILAVLEEARRQLGAK